MRAKTARRAADTARTIDKITDAGWVTVLRKPWHQVGWTVRSWYVIDQAPAHVRAEAGPDRAGDEHLHLLWWAPSLRHATAKAARLIAAKERTPRSEWLGAPFTSGPARTMLKDVQSGDMIALKYGFWDGIPATLDRLGRVEVIDTAGEILYRVGGRPLDLLAVVWDVHVITRAQVKAGE